MVQEQSEALPLESHSFGPDGISRFCVCKTFPVILEFATGLFNPSVRLSRCPTFCKRACIRPLSKSRTPKSPSETRPIANLSVLSKIFERIIHKQMTGYAEKFDIFDAKQSGYRSGFSTQTALLRICDDVRWGVERGCVTILVLFDLSKAFDTISHVLLLKKLKSLGLSNGALIWIHSYLTGRSQAVMCENGVLSDWLFTTAGVPQGSFTLCLFYYSLCLLFIFVTG